MKQYKTVNNLVGWITFLIAATVYCMTIEPTASFWDCPEFITTGYKLEVGHPPGAPFFMLVANLFSQFASDASTVAKMVNYMSALMSGACILFLFWSITHLVRKLVVTDENNITRGQMVTIMGSGLVGALAYTFSDTFWFSAVEGEVYAFSSLFTAVVFWLILKWEDVANEPHSDRWLILIAYLVPEGEEPKSLHARVCSKGTISGKEFMERVFREEHMPHAMVVGIVQAITTTLGDWLAKGYTVEIEGLGFFSTTLKCTHPVMNKKEVRAESVKMSTVKFRPGIEFKRYVAGKMELERADKRFFPDKPKAMGDMAAREKSMMDFLEANVCITRAEYSRLVHVTARRASRDLQTFIDSGVIRKRGGGRSVVYVKC